MIVRRLTDLFRRRRLDADLDAELRHHIESLEAEHRARGLSHEAAKDAAAIDMGRLLIVRESYREQHGLPRLESLWRDVRLGCRSLRRTPGVTAAIVATLAIGIGANTAIFSVVHGVLLKPLPYPQPETLVSVSHATRGVGDLPSAPYLYYTYRDQNRTFTGVGLWRGGAASVTGSGSPERVEQLGVTADILPILGVEPLLGRVFSRDDEQPRAGGTVVLTYGYWQRRFGGDPQAVGRAITVDGQSVQIIGVMPRTFRFLDRPVDIIAPFQFDRAQVRLGRYIFQSLARLRPGATIETAGADVARMVPLAIDAFEPPPGYTRAQFHRTGIGPRLQPLQQEVVGDLGSTLWVLMGAIGLVLLIACANVANLLLVRTEGRQQELAVRAALGAGRARIARELLTESAVLGLLGGGAGLAVASGALALLRALRPAHLPRIDEIALDPSVLLFTLIVSVAAGLLFGLLPVLKYANPALASALRGSGRSMSQSRERHRARNTLVVVQVALALVLLICSGLMIRTFQAIARVDPGFTQPEAVQMAHVNIPAANVSSPEHAARLQQQIVERLTAIPGVTSAAFADIAPLSGGADSDTILFTDGRVRAPNEVKPLRRFEYISPGLFRTLGTPLVAGRDLTWDDLHGKRLSALVSENLARDEWGSAAAAIGRRVRISPADPWRTIVGVVGNIHDNGLHRPAPPIVFFPALMDRFSGRPTVGFNAATFVLRTPRAGAEGLIHEIERAVWSVDANLPVTQPHTLRDASRQTLGRTSFALVMLALAGGMGLVLGIIGIYGLIAYAVSQRTQEIGIRLALGAQHGALKRLFVRQGLLLAGVGVAIGLAVSALVTRLMASLLFGVDPMDFMTYAVVTMVLLAVAAIAAYVPARRSTTVAPLQALRLG